MDSDPGSWVPLGTLLLRRGLLSSEQLEILLEEKEGSGLRIGELAVAFGWASSAEVAQALAEQFGIAFRDLDSDPPSSEALELISPETAVRERAVPLSIDDGVLEIGVADPTDIAAIERLRHLVPHPVSICVVDSTALLNHLAAAGQLA